MYKEIDALEKTQLEVRMYSQPMEEFRFILLLALAIIIFELVLRLTLLRNTF